MSEFEEPPAALASRMAAQFDVPPPVEPFDFPQRGNINIHTYRVVSGRGEGAREYLLQQINPRVFRRPARVMAAMTACIEAQRRGLSRRDPARTGPWEVIRLIPTRGGAPWLDADDLGGRSVWRLMERIPRAQTCRSLAELPPDADPLRVAREAGRAMALFGDLVADLDASALPTPLPGYRNPAVYYAQLDAVLRGARTPDECADLLPSEPDLRESTELHFLVHASPAEAARRRADPEVARAVDTALEHRAFAMTLLDDLAAGRLPRTAIHGDPKLDNILFDTGTGCAKAFVDLDTVMPHTWLVDWGDLVRSLANVAGERERDLDRVRVDRDVFAAIAAGFLDTSETVRDPAAEAGRMIDAIRIQTLELGVRFLADYLRGDSYCRLSATDAADLNRLRALVQFRLFARLGEEAEALRAVIAEYRGGGAPCGS